MSPGMRELQQQRPQGKDSLPGNKRLLFNELTADSTVVVELINVTAIILYQRKQEVQIPKWKSFMTQNK